MKQAIHQSNVGPLAIYNTRNEISLSAIKNRTARKIANRIKTVLSAPKPVNSSAGRSKECDFGSRFCYRQALIQNHLNFRRSDPPSRFMFFSNDSWNDFSKDVFGFLRAAFLAGMPVVEGSVEGSSCLFDFLRMVQINLVMGQERSIAWIDVRGQCFFPKLVVGGEFESGCEKPFCPKLEIEIRIKTDLEEKSDNFSYSAKACDEKNPPHDVDKPQSACVDKPFVESDTPSVNCGRPKWPCVEILKESDTVYLAIKNMFLSGIGRFKQNINVTSIYICVNSGPLRVAQLKAFKSQMALTGAARGNANVKLCWYGTSGEDVAGIVEHGFAQHHVSSSSDTHGVGVYLAPQHLSNLSAGLSSVDSNGEKHVILCRVIVGKAEKVEPGSRQFHPSTDEYDCGVDDLENPRWYVVWSSHMNQHILPECVVSFKTSDQLKDSSKNMTVFKRTIPTSSTLSFQKLFSEIGKQLPSSRLQELERLYVQYKAGKITKDVLVRQIRTIAGDKLLIATIRRVRGH